MARPVWSRTGTPRSTAQSQQLSAVVLSVKWRRSVRGEQVGCRVPVRDAYV
jgi:hypothetical protein